MKKDMSGIGCPVSSRRKNSPKGKKNSPKILPIIAMIAGQQMQKDKETAEGYSKYTPGKYGGKQEGPRTMMLDD